jgi:hypothetical protein
MHLEVVCSHRGLLGGAPQSVQQIWHYRHLLLLLTRRGIKVRTGTACSGCCGA